MTTKVQLKRINILIEELEKLRASTPRPKFNMGMWCELTGRDEKDSWGRAVSNDTRAELRAKIKAAVLNPCGTAACLCGKAGLMPRFRRMGFRWDVSKSGKVEGKFYYSKRGRARDTYGEVATMEFFGFDVYDDVFINVDEIKTLSQGIKALKRFVAATV